MYSSLFGLFIFYSIFYNLFFFFDGGFLVSILILYFYLNHLYNLLGVYCSGICIGIDEVPFFFFRRVAGRVVCGGAWTDNAVLSLAK